MTPGFTTHESSRGRKQKRTLNTPVNQLQHAVPVQQRYKTTAGHGKYHTPLDTAIRTLRLETSKRGRPNTPHCPSSAGSSQKDLDAPIPKELGLPSLEGGTVCTRCLCTQINKPNWNRTSPARSHTPNEIKSKEMPPNQKPSGKSAPKSKNQMA